MADSVWGPASAASSPSSNSPSLRHPALVRITHWLITVSFLALLLTGIEILISHPRFYWGETGNDLSRPLFVIPIPASRDLVPTGYGYTLPDQNGWSRYLHFEAAWLAVLTGLLYLTYGLVSGHFRRNLAPSRGDLSPGGIWNVIRGHLRLGSRADDGVYNVLQRLVYLCVIFILFPLVIWTGLAMSLAFDSAFPAAVALLGGQQSARTLHLLVSAALVMFLFVHIVMVCISGFRGRLRAMITGRGRSETEGA